MGFKNLTKYLRLSNIQSHFSFDQFRGQIIGVDLTNLCYQLSRAHMLLKNKPNFFYLHIQKLRNLNNQLKLNEAQQKHVNKCSSCKEQLSHPGPLLRTKLVELLENFPEVPKLVTDVQVPTVKELAEALFSHFQAQKIRLILVEDGMYVRKDVQVSEKPKMKAHLKVSDANSAIQKLLQDCQTCPCQQLLSQVFASQFESKMIVQDSSVLKNFSNSIADVASKFNFPTIQASAEADHQLAAMSRTGIIAAVLGYDSDYFTLNVETVLKIDPYQYALLGAIKSSKLLQESQSTANYREFLEYFESPELLFTQYSNCEESPIINLPGFSQFQKLGFCILALGNECYRSLFPPDVAFCFMDVLFKGENQEKITDLTMQGEIDLLFQFLEKGSFPLQWQNDLILDIADDSIVIKQGLCQGIQLFALSDQIIYGLKINMYSYLQSLIFNIFTEETLPLHHFISQSISNPELYYKSIVFQKQIERNKNYCRGFLYQKLLQPQKNHSGQNINGKYLEYMQTKFDIHTFFPNYRQVPLDSRKIQQQIIEVSSCAIGKENLRLCIFRTTVGQCYLCLLKKDQAHIGQFSPQQKYCLSQINPTRLSLKDQLKKAGVEPTFKFSQSSKK